MTYHALHRSEAKSVTTYHAQTWREAAEWLRETILQVNTDTAAALRSLRLCREGQSWLWETADGHLFELMRKGGE